MGICFRPAEEGPTNANTLKILCLGLGGCGKSTFISQMKFLHNLEIDDQTLGTFANIIRKNFTIGMKEIINIAQANKWDFLPENQDNVSHAKDLWKNREHGINQENYKILQSVWEDPTSKRVIKEKRSHLSVTHIDYLWGRVQDVINPDFRPTEEDILHVRSRTAGSYSVLTQFEKMYFEFYDVGGQRPEREKWAELLHNVNLHCILFFIATDEWDVIDEELNEFNQTKMQVSKAIFKEILSSDVVPKSVQIIVFLNRFDLFTERINSDDGWKSFVATFGETSRKPTEAIQSVIEYYKESISNHKLERISNFHTTTALSKTGMQKIWQDVRNAILQEALRSISL